MEQIFSRAALAGAAVLCLLGCASPTPEDSPWPRFRGPNGSGVAESSRLPNQIGADNLIWKTDVPAGYSSPTLTETRIFLTGYEDGELLTLCIDRKTGRILWQRSISPERKDPLDAKNTPASPTPATDGSSVYSFFQDSGLVSYDLDGNERWRLPLGPFNNFYGMASSPILVDGKLILACDQDTNSFLVAVDTKTGSQVWEVDRSEFSNSYSTPVLLPSEVGPPTVVVAGSFQLMAYSSDRGEKLWGVSGIPWMSKALPVLGDGAVFVNARRASETPLPPVPEFTEVITSFDRNGDSLMSLQEVPDEHRAWFAGIDRDRDQLLGPSEWAFYRDAVLSDGGLFAIESGVASAGQNRIRWHYDKSVADIASTLFYRDLLYMINDGGILSIFDPASGSLVKRTRLKGAGGRYFASPIAADGKILFLNEQGVATVVHAGPETETLGVSRLRENSYATPAIGDDQVYVRTDEALYCFGS